VLFIVIVALPCAAHAHNELSYEDFAKLANDASAFQITVGDDASRHTKIIRPLILRSSADLPGADPVESSVVPRDKNNPARAHVISSCEFSALIAAIGLLRATWDDGYGRGRSALSLSISIASPEVHEFHCTLGREDSERLFEALRAIVTGSLDASREIAVYSCMFGFLENARPQDVTAAASVRFSAMRRNADSDRFVTMVTIRNDSETALPPPVSLVIARSPAEVGYENMTGRTCTSVRGGHPYFNVDAQNPVRAQCRLVSARSSALRSASNDGGLNEIRPPASRGQPSECSRAGPRMDSVDTCSGTWRRDSSLRPWKLRQCAHHEDGEQERRRDVRRWR